MTQVQTKPWERPLKAKTPETYWDKSYMECYQFCQQCEDYFKTLAITKINCIPFATSFFCGTISIRWAQHKRHHKNTTPITWSDFKTFFQQDYGSSQAFIDSI